MHGLIDVAFDCRRLGRRFQLSRVCPFFGVVPAVLKIQPGILLYPYTAEWA